MCAVQCVFRTELGFCVLGVCLGMDVCGGKFSESVLMCKTLECILCKYIPAVKRGMHAI